MQELQEHQRPWSPRNNKNHFDYGWAEVRYWSGTEKWTLWWMVWYWNVLRVRHYQ